MPKSDLFIIEITLRHGCSPINLLHIFRTPFSLKKFWWLLPIVFDLQQTFWKNHEGYGIFTINLPHIKDTHREK